MSRKANMGDFDSGVEQQPEIHMEMPQEAPIPPQDLIDRVHGNEPGKTIVALMDKYPLHSILAAISLKLALPKTFEGKNGLERSLQAGLGLVIGKNAQAALLLERMHEAGEEDGHDA